MLKVGTIQALTLFGRLSGGFMAFCLLFHKTDKFKRARILEKTISGDVKKIQLGFSNIHLLL